MCKKNGEHYWIFIKNIISHPGCLARNYIQKAKIIYIYIYQIYEYNNR